MRRVALLLGFAVVVLAVGAPASAVKPETFKIDVSEFGPFESAFATEACGFPVEADIRGHIIVTLFADGPSPIVELDRFNVRITYTNPATGETFRLVDSGPDIYRDGTVTITGRSITGSGVIGRVVFDLDTFEILFEAGNRVNEGFGNYIFAVCEALDA